MAGEHTDNVVDVIFDMCVTGEHTDDVVGVIFCELFSCYARC